MTEAFSWSEWSRLGAVELTRRVRNGDVTRDEVASQARNAALRVEPALDALVELLDAPHRPPDVPGAEGGMLDGLPLFLKDLGSSVAGLKRELGSALHRDSIVERTDPLAAAWLREGAQVLGRATTAELGMAYDTSTTYRGLKVTRNPWNPRFTAGGSSGGSAALVAAGVAPVAHATDGAGSIRLPAALNGLVGLKVTRGRLPPLWGANELSNATFVEGVVARTLEDAALLLDAATKHSSPAGSHYVAPGHEATRALRALAEPSRKPLRVGVTTARFGRQDDLSAEHVRAVVRAADALASAGHEVETVPERELPDFPALFAAFTTFWVGVRAGSWKGARGSLSAPELAELTPVARRYHLASVRFQKDAIVEFLLTNAGLTRAFGRLLERYDVLLLPASPYRTAEANGPLSTCNEQSFETFLERFLDHGRYTIPASLVGLPALTIPAGFDQTGLPLAIQLYGRFRAETALLDAGQTLERLLGMEHRTPEVHVTRASGASARR